MSTLIPFKNHSDTEPIYIAKDKITGFSTYRGKVTVFVAVGNESEEWVISNSMEEARILYDNAT